MPFHVSHICLRRQIPCLFCGLLNEYKDMENHVKDCEFVTIPCELCNEELPRREMFDHISEEGNCPYSTLPCQYATIGCHEKVIRKEMNAHMSDAVVSHQQLLFNNLVSLQTEQKKADCKIKNLQEALRSQQNTADCKIKELQKANRKLQSENSEMGLALKSLRGDFSKQAKEIELKFKEVQLAPRQFEEVQPQLFEEEQPPLLFGQNPYSRKQCMEAPRQFEEALTPKEEQPFEPVSSSWKPTLLFDREPPKVSKTFGSRASKTFGPKESKSKPFRGAAPKGFFG
ncbi:TNF receptor-associated factor 6-like [Oscarella lobularis]|uniref:TNF receptor-associated factor 6-like n=1 Tax=Oscarella lobularis TaxID=121494 RepID=UPI0033140525